MPAKPPQPRPDAPTELWRQADVLVQAEGYTRADWRHHMAMEPVRPFRIQGGQIEVRVRETGEVIEVLSEAAYDQRMEECVA